MTLEDHLKTQYAQDHTIDYHVRCHFDDPKHITFDLCPIDSADETVSYVIFGNLLRPVSVSLSSAVPFIPLDPTIPPGFCDSTWLLNQETLDNLNTSIHQAQEVGSPTLTFLDAKSNSYPISVTGAVHFQQSLENLIASGFKGSTATIKQTSDIEIGVQISW